MKQILSVIFIFFAVIASAHPGDTLRIKGHQAVDMIWHENYDTKVQFPTSKTTYSKILMHYTLGCASGGCGDWDYTTKIELLIPTGKKDSVQVIKKDEGDASKADTSWSIFDGKEAFELGRVMTPYGAYMRLEKFGHKADWKHTYTFDVTDYAPLLKGEKEIRAFYGGWSAGFSVTIDFEFIEGTPPREVLEVRNLWQTSGKGWDYITSESFEKERLKPLDVQFSPATKEAKLRFIPSGHGFDNTTYCAEFCAKKYFLKVDGKQIGENEMWRSDCGMNPIFPQAGTWLYDRANWCPGTRTIAFDHELTNYVKANQSSRLDIDIENVEWEGKQNPSYILETHLFVYGEKNFQHDATITEILSPTTKVDHQRMNPVCEEVVFELKNQGAQPLTKATISYSIDQQTWKSFIWKGNLQFDEKELVHFSIPELSNLDVTKPHQFQLKVIDPNGEKDENGYNDVLSSTFEVVPVLPTEMVLWMATNGKADQTKWTLFDSKNQIVYQSKSSLDSFHLYQDTLRLQEGCYLLRIEDSGKNGLNFWANDEGSGYIRLMGSKNKVLKSFLADFGTKIDFYFSVKAEDAVIEKKKR